MDHQLIALLLEQKRQEQDEDQFFALADEDRDNERKEEVRSTERVREQEKRDREKEREKKQREEKERKDTWLLNYELEQKRKRQRELFFMRESAVREAIEKEENTFFKKMVAQCQTYQGYKPNPTFEIRMPMLQWTNAKDWHRHVRRAQKKSVNEEFAYQGRSINKRIADMTEGERAALNQGIIDRDVERRKKKVSDDPLPRPILEIVGKKRVRQST